MSGTVPSPTVARLSEPEAPTFDQREPTPSPTRAGLVPWAFRWLPVAIIPITAMLLFTRLYRPIADPDTFWHLRLGTYLWETWRFSGPEPWSSLAERPLVMHEWSPELLYVLVHSAFGWSGLAYLQAIGAVTVLLTLYLCSRQFSPPLVASLTALTTWAGTAGSLALRPQVVSFVLFAVFTTAWLKTSDDGRPRWWLIPLTWAWACSHGMWFLGPAVGSVVVLGLAADRKLDRRGAVRLVSVPVGGALVAALTPVGPRLLASPGGMRDYTRFVGEWQTPSPFMLQTAVTLAMAAALVVLWSRTPISRSWTDLLLMAVAVACTLAYARTIALGAIILGLLTARTASRVLAVRGTQVLDKRREVTVLGIGLAVVCLIGPWIARADVSAPARVPTAFDASLDRLPPNSVVFNDYQLGGWLLWEHPALDPVIDGRADVYGVEHFESVINAYDAVPGWQDTFESSGASAALLQQGSGLADALVDYAGWTNAGEDEGYVLLLPPRG